MNKNSSTPLLKLFEEVLFLTKILGVNQVIQEINNLKSKIYKEPTLLEITKESVCENFKITYKEFLNGTSRTNKTRYDSRSVYTYLLADVFKVSRKSIQNKLDGCSNTSIATMINYIRCLDEKISFDKELLNKIEIIKLDIETKINIKID